MTRWQDDHDPLCPSSRAKDWQAYFALWWCQCDAIRAGRREGEADFQRYKAAILGDLRAGVEALRDNALKQQQAYGHPSPWTAYVGAYEHVLDLIDGAAG